MKTLAEMRVGDLVYRVNRNRAEQVVIFAIGRKYIQVAHTTNTSRPIDRQYHKDSGWEKGYETVGGYVDRLRTEDQYLYDTQLQNAHNGIWRMGFSKHVGVNIPAEKIIAIYEAMKAIMEAPDEIT